MSWWGDNGRTAMARDLAAEREALVLGFVQRFMAEHDYGPTIRQIADGIGVKSPSTAHRTVTALRLSGQLTLVPIRGRVQVKT